MRRTFSAAFLLVGVAAFLGLAGSAQAAPQQPTKPAYQLIAHTLVATKGHPAGTGFGGSLHRTSGAPVSSSHARRPVVLRAWVPAR
jgi:hypothetical protein